MISSMPRDRGEVIVVVRDRLRRGLSKDEYPHLKDWQNMNL